MRSMQNVLVVDDDDVVHLTSEKILSGFADITNVYRAYNGKEALKIVQDGCDGRLVLPDLILVDLHMPIMDGLQFIKEFVMLDCLAGKQSNVVIAVVSASRNPEEQQRARNMGVRHFIAKPISTEKVKQIVAVEFSSTG